MTGGTEKRTKIYRRGIAEAATELHALREDPSNLARLLQLQAYLVARLRQSQRFIEKRRADLVALRRARSLGRPATGGEVRQLAGAACGLAAMVRDQLSGGATGSAHSGLPTTSGRQLK